MISDLDETLKELLISRGGLAPSLVDIRFDPPARDRAHPPKTPTINLYMYDIHENVEQREVYWDTVMEGSQRARITRRPLRIDVAYMVTCAAPSVNDEHRLLWQVLETLFRNSPLPDDALQGNMQRLLRPAQTRVAQPDGIFKGPVDLWSAMQGQIPPAINLIVTIELDLNDVRTVPLVFSRTIKVGRSKVTRSADGHEVPVEELEPGWEPAPVELGGVVHGPGDLPVIGAAVRLLATGGQGVPVQIGTSLLTDEHGHYRFESVRPGDYNIVIEVPGQAPIQRPICITVSERGDPLPNLVQQVDISV